MGYSKGTRAHLATRKRLHDLSTPQALAALDAYRDRINRQTDQTTCPHCGGELDQTLTKTEAKILVAIRMQGFRLGQRTV